MITKEKLSANKANNQKFLKKINDLKPGSFICVNSESIHELLKKGQKTKIKVKNNKIKKIKIKANAGIVSRNS